MIGLIWKQVFSKLVKFQVFHIYSHLSHIISYSYIISKQGGNCRHVPFLTSENSMGSAVSVFFFSRDHQTTHRNCSGWRVLYSNGSKFPILSFPSRNIAPTGAFLYITAEASILSPAPFIPPGPESHILSLTRPPPNRSISHDDGRAPPSHLATTASSLTSHRRRKSFYPLPFSSKPEPAFATPKQTAPFLLRRCRRPPRRSLLRDTVNLRRFVGSSSRLPGLPYRVDMGKSGARPVRRAEAKRKSVHSPDDEGCCVVDFGIHLISEYNFRKICFRDYLNFTFPKISLVRSVMTVVEVKPFSPQYDTPCFFL